MFVRRRGCRLQVMRSYRNERGKPTNESIGVVPVFESTFDSGIYGCMSDAERLNLEEQRLVAKNLCQTEVQSVVSQFCQKGAQLVLKWNESEDFYKVVMALKKFM